MRRISRFSFEVGLETRHVCGNRNCLAARNAGHSTIALCYFCNHLNLADGLYTGRPEHITLPQAKLSGLAGVEAILRLGLINKNTY
jgi:hypothetical protein